MATVTNSSNGFTVKAYAGDAKTLLAFNLDEKSARNLAGFTIKCAPGGQSPYFIHNQLQFKTPADHAQDPKEPANSSMNAPIHKFRWVHVPGAVHQGLEPYMGSYTYTVTPRYFNESASLLPLDPGLSVALKIKVAPFAKGNLALGFARGFTQSQAFVHHFGKDAVIKPKTAELLFDTSQTAGSNAYGDKYTYRDEYGWLGFTAREMIFDLLDEVQKDESLHLDMFAYDLNEPDIMRILLQLAGQGRIRMILDNASLHHDPDDPKPEDQFEGEFRKRMTGKAGILRGHFGRYSHDKVLIVSNDGGCIKVLTGSTNFSVTGIYVNSNHVVSYNDPEVATFYSDVFNEAWADKTSKSKFTKCPLSTGTFRSKSKATPVTEFTFAPHAVADATGILDGVAGRITAETQAAGGSVLFAVMEMDNGQSPVYTALKSVHDQTSIFSYGISDNPGGIYLYKPGSKEGILVSGKPAKTVLPPPFDQVPGVGFGHQVHHKFVVCGFNRPDAVVYCGSSNLALGGEENNGDNLLAIRDSDVATAFAIEALCLVDHFNFLDKYSTGGTGSSSSPAKAKSRVPSATPVNAAASAGWFLSTSDGWTKPYFDPDDLKYADRVLFG